MGRDLVSRPYGRFFYIPHYLAERGHDIELLLLDYSNGEPLDTHAHGMRIVSVPLRLHQPGLYTAKIRQLIREARPDWLIGLSDTYYGILAQHYGDRYGIRSCIDAYDNYESYIPWMKPLHGLWRRALSRADLLTAAGPGLLQYMSRQRAVRPSIVLPMAADPNGFGHLDQVECRSRMGLAAEGRYVGYCGSAHKNRGLDVLFEAMDRLRVKRPEIRLLLSGRSWKNVPIPDSAQQLGYITDADMPVLLNCMDVLTVLNRTTSFGNYSHPVKLYEAMSCGVPVIATTTPATQWILRDYPDSLVPPADPEALCGKIDLFLDRGRIAYSGVPDWKTTAAVLERALQQQLSDTRTGTGG